MVHTNIKTIHKINTECEKKNTRQLGIKRPHTPSTYHHAHSYIKIPNCSLESSCKSHNHINYDNHYVYTTVTVNELLHNKALLCTKLINKIYCIVCIATRLIVISHADVNGWYTETFSPVEHMLHTRWLCHCK